MPPLRLRPSRCPDGQVPRVRRAAGPEDWIAAGSFRLGGARDGARMLLGRRRGVRHDPDLRDHFAAIAAGRGRAVAGHGRRRVRDPERGIGLADVPAQAPDHVLDSAPTGLVRGDSLGSSHPGARVFRSSDGVFAIAFCRPIVGRPCAASRWSSRPCRSAAPLASWSLASARHMTRALSRCAPRLLRWPRPRCGRPAPPGRGPRTNLRRRVRGG